MFGSNVIGVLAPGLVVLAPVLLIWVITRERLSIAVVRRLYVYAAAFLGLQLAAVGARGMLSVLLERLSASVVGSPEEEVQRLSLATALLIVGFPLWGFHWSLAQRSADRSEERHSPVRRLYGYAVLAVSMLVLLFSSQDLIGGVLRPSGLDLTPGWIPRAIASLLIYGAIWAYHWRVMGADRAVVEAADAPATLRRWYLVVVQAFGLATAALGATNLISQLLRVWLVPAIGQAPPFGWMVAGLVAGLAVWLPHHLWARQLVRRPGPLREDEARSTLRQVYAAVVITLTAAAALGAFASLLRAVLLVAFGGMGWASVLEDYTLAIAAILVAVPIWAYHRRQLAEEALLADIPARPDTARRVIWYLTAAVGLGALFFGLGGLVYTLLQMVLTSNAIGAGWREPLSTSLALSSVALPIYAVAARAIESLVRRSPAEERTLARRIYLYGALLFGISATIVTGVTLLRVILQFVLGAPPPNPAVDLSRWLGYCLVAAAIAAHHAVLVRRAGRTVVDIGGGTIVAVVADPPLQQAIANGLRHELPGAEVRVSGTRELEATSSALAGADVLILTLGALLETGVAEAAAGYAGSRILIPTEVAGYELVGTQANPEALARDAARMVRECLGRGTEGAAARPRHQHPPLGGSGGVERK